MGAETTELRPGVVVQVDPRTNVAFGGCFAHVVRVRSWGVVAEAPVPDLYGPRAAPLRLPTGTFAAVGTAPWPSTAPPHDSDDADPAALPPPPEPGRLFVDRMEEWRRAVGWTQTQFTAHLGITEGYWRQIRRDPGRLTAGLARRVLGERPEFEHYPSPARSRGYDDGR